MKKIKLPLLKCKRCGKEWHPRRERMPVRCPRCGSPYWNRDYERKTKKKVKKV